MSLSAISKKSEFKKIVSDCKIPVFVKFFATWCGPCKMMTPVLERVSEDFDGHVKFLEVDVDNCENLSEDYFVSSVPTFIIFKNGDEFNRISGACTYEQLESFVKSATAVV